MTGSLNKDRKFEILNIVQKNLLEILGKEKTDEILNNVYKDNKTKLTSIEEIEEIDFPYYLK